MGEFKRGQIFRAKLPDTKFEANIQPPSPLISGERFVVVLHNFDNENYDERQVLVAPIVPEEEVVSSGNPLLITHIALGESEFPFLGKDSLVCTHQILPINREWLNDKAVADLSGSELNYKIELGIINAAGLTELIEAFVEEKASELKIEYAKPKISKNDTSSVVTSARSFKRGDVFYSQMPEQIFNYGITPPSFTIHGEHMVVVLHDSDDINYDTHQVLIVPITSAKAAVRDGKLLATHIPVLPSEFSFIKRESFVSTHQIMPVNRGWLDPSPKGDLHSKMLEVDLGIILASDLSAFVSEMVDERLEELSEMALKKIQDNNIKDV